MTTDSFEWTSDSEEAWDDTLTFSLSTYSALTAVELQFPVGETYLFDLELYDERFTFSSTPTGDYDPHTTIQVSIRLPGISVCRCVYACKPTVRESELCI